MEARTMCKEIRRRFPVILGGALFLATRTAHAAEDTRKWIWRCALVHTPSEEQEAKAERCCKRRANAPHCNGDYTKALSLPPCAKLPHLAHIKIPERIIL